MIEPEGLHAVVTGDTVESSALAPEARRALPDTFHDAYAAVRDTAPDVLPYEMAITGGDGWQWYVDEPADALARVLHFWTLLYSSGVVSRMALVIDTVDFISEDDLNESDGPAFRRSGRLLSDLSEGQRFACAVQDQATPAHQVAIQSIAELLDLFLQQWTEAQAQAIAGILPTVGTNIEVTQQEIAEHWSPEPITRQTVNRHLKRAYWDRVQRTLDRFTRLVESL